MNEMTREEIALKKTLRNFIPFKKIQPVIFFLPFLLLFLLSSTPACQESGPRPENWAKPISLPGVPNFHQVSETLYRSGQPTAEGFRALEKFGIKTIINLRSEHSDRKLLSGTNLKYFDIPSKATEIREGDLKKFLDIVTNPENLPALIHCHHGADRAGLFSAFYRIVVQGWSKEEAIREMQKGGFGFHNTYTNIVKYLMSFNPEKFRQAIKTSSLNER